MFLSLLMCFAVVCSYQKEINEIASKSVDNSKALSVIESCSIDYENALFEFLKINQGYSSKLYKSSENEDVIGLGIKLAEAEKILGREIEEITEDESQMLHQIKFEEHEKIMQNKMKTAGINEEFSQLFPEIKICMHSLCWSSPNAIGPGFLSGLKELLNFKEEGLKKMIDEVVNKTNPKKHEGLQNRRNKEGLSLLVLGRKLYSKTDEG